MEQKKISQCSTRTIDWDSPSTDAYFAAIDKQDGSFQNFKVSVSALMTALNSKFTAINNRIDGISGGGSSGGGSESGGGSGEGTTPSGDTTDLTEINNRLTILETEISNFKTSNNWPVNTIILKNSAGAEIARYDLPSNYLGTGYTQDNSIVINVNSSAAPKYTIEMGLGMWSVTSSGVSVPISIQYWAADGQQGGNVQTLQVQGSFKTTSTTIPATNLNYVTETTTVPSSATLDTRNMAIDLANADQQVITLTAELYLDGSNTPIIVLSSTWQNGADTPSRRYIVTT